MTLKYFLSFLLVFLFIIQVQSQHNATNNSTDIKEKVTRKPIIMRRKLHKDEKQGKGMVHMVIHKIQPGHLYYKIFDNDEKAARGFTNKIWNRLLNRYSTMLL
ncbi:uncharacterized protein LOC108051262 [Drosophila rhopaloa]|uniref:Uncharacterized protein LOC108051262 n=1 Tax=Drosophila rhopaloa TaxID=1041015 RepID=A0A6P4FHP5_DRORH|nr:uncharacterized protein LOC108051262 [Drosophila rhopaloa]